MAGLPPVAVLRIVASVRADLDAYHCVCPDPVIPVSEDAWRAVLTDSRLLTSNECLLEELSQQVLSATVSGDASALKAAASAVQREASSFAEDLQLVSVLEPSRGGLAVILRKALLALAVGILDCVGDRLNREELAQLQEEAEAALLKLRQVETGFAEDPFLVAFGLHAEVLYDGRGVPTVSRILGSYYGRYDELLNRLRPLFLAIGQPMPTLENAAEVALGLIGAPRVLPTLRAFRAVAEMMDVGIATAGVMWANPRLELMERIARSYSSHQATIRSVHNLKAASSNAQRAELMLDAYRRTIEGQLRPSAWGLLRLKGKGSERMPEISSLREQLLKDATPTALDAAQAILPAVRNAAAHEDFAWDDRAQRIWVGETSVTIEELEDGLELAHSIVVGIECAWSCARARWPQLAKYFNSNLPGYQHQLVAAHRDALAFFGTNGLRVRSWKHEGDAFTVTVEELPSRLVNPAFQAMMWAARVLDPYTDRFQLRLDDDGDPLIEVNRLSLDATFAVWWIAQSKFSAMPPVVFLPANTYARMAVEPIEVTVDSVSWFALNAAVQAYDELDGAESDAMRREHLRNNLGLVVAGLGYTIPLLPSEVVDPLRRIIAALDTALVEELNEPRDKILVLARHAEVRLRRLHAKLPVPAHVPSLDPRPLNFPI